MIRGLIIGLILGSVGGWSVRVCSTTDRYVLAHAKRLEAEKQYFDKKLDELIESNIQKYGRPLKAANKGE